MTFPIQKHFAPIAARLERYAAHVRAGKWQTVELSEVAGTHDVSKMDVVRKFELDGTLTVTLRLTRPPKTPTTERR